MEIKEIEQYYAGIAIILELFLGTVVLCLSVLVLVGYLKCHGWKKPSGLTVMNLLVADVINGIIAPLQAAYIHCLLHKTKAADLFRTIFFLQCLFLWVSPLVMIVLNISRLIAILLPFQYTKMVSRQTTGIALALIWITGFINSFLKRYVNGYSKYQFYVSGVLFHLIMNVVILGLAIYTIIVLKSSYSKGHSDPRVKATKTLVVVSIVYFLTFGYYIYVHIIWMIPDLPYTTTNQWLIFTAIGKWSLSLAHLFLLGNSIFNGIIFGMQANIKKALDNIWVKDYYRSSLREQALPIVTQ